MNLPSAVLSASVLIMFVSPLVLLGLLSLAAAYPHRFSEKVVGRWTQLALVVGLAAAITGLTDYLTTGSDPVVISYGTWFSFGHGSFAVEFVADGLSLGFAALALSICGVVSSFSFRYLHREPGFHRYFIQFSMFVLGITLVALAGTIEVLFAGWELIGLSSALLVGFFHERRAPVVNALRVFVVYRISDAAMLGAAILLHHWAGSGSLSQLFSSSPSSVSVLDSRQVLTIAALLIVAVSGKSALLPFSGWLPRAMEGPTPSSAVYYGALSIHAGCFLLLRAEPLLAQSDGARVLAALLGLSTTIYATIAARVQTDVKSALSFASLTQVGIIVVEIALGFRWVAFIHIIGHVCFRVLQFLRAPNILHDLHDIENRIGGHIDVAHDDVAPLRRWTRGLYLAALERGFVDSLLDRFAVDPFCRIVRRLDGLDRVLSGGRHGAGEGP